MADVSQSTWNVNDASNNASPPDGFPEGMQPSGVNNGARMMMGATKRFWERINGTQTAAFASNQYSLGYTVTAPTLVSGEMYVFRIADANTAATQLNVGTGGAQALVKMVAGGVADMTTNDLGLGQYLMAVWDSVSSQFVVLNVPPDTASLSAVMKADMSSISSVLETHINAVSAAAAAGGGSAGAAIASLDARITSQSALWTAETASLSDALATRLNSLSSTLGLRMDALSATTSNLYLDIRSLSQTLSVKIASLSSDLQIKMDVISNSVSALVAQVDAISAGFSSRINAVSATVSNLYRDIRSLSATISLRMASLSSVFTTRIDSINAEAVFDTTARSIINRDNTNVTAAAWITVAGVGMQATITFTTTFSTTGYTVVVCNGSGDLGATGNVFYIADRKVDVFTVGVLITVPATYQVSWIAIGPEQTE